MVKQEHEYRGLAQKHGEVTSTPIDILYWCGKVDKVIRENPLILTPAEQKKHDKAVAKLEAQKPWPICKKCQQAKAKVNK